MCVFVRECMCVRDRERNRNFLALISVFEMISSTHTQKKRNQIKKGKAKKKNLLSMPSNGRVHDED